ncbi:DUF748 domain-containing protein [Paraburkholderia sp. DHOC27]|uniref:DUF748 domain-containing protein n=1 Tax=Paraburkholderia sp. DHOC27 TaxID=2303330 RepID=UPI000E3BB2D6|nr:DUF748 domain-containing protein [Paraburkholderia sp. DHOC27]RFU43986.1 DUF748 domain-containing protein [Paraburkholderia sp. DHOC27]
MAMSIPKRVAIAVGAIVLVLVVVVLGGLYFVQFEVKQRVTAALGPLGSADSIDVGLTSVRLTNVLLKPPPDWPAPNVLHADQITIVPDIRDLLQRRIHIRSVTVSGFDLTVVRTAGGSIDILPNLKESLNRPDNATPASVGSPTVPREKLIDHIGFEHGTFEFYDFTVSKPAYKVSVTNAVASVDHLHLPALTEPTSVEVNGSIAGPQHTGTVSFGGWIKIATKDSQTTSTLQGVDIVMLDPYLLKKTGAKAEITGGTVDLTVQSTVTNYQLHAPGTVVLHNLQLADTGNPLDTFLSIPTKLAVAALKSRKGDITVHFVLEGNLRDPKFSVNDNFLMKLGTGFAKSTGVSVEGVAKGAGDTVKGLGNALKNLLGQ